METTTNTLTEIHSEIEARSDLTKAQKAAHKAVATRKFNSDFGNADPAAAIANGSPGNIHGAKVGDILSGSWGYDQTNIDFYKVVGVTKTGVKIRRLETAIERTGEGGHYDYVVPGAEQDWGVRYGDDEAKAKAPKWKKTHEAYRGDGYSVRIESYLWISPWSGEPCTQTGYGFGH